MTSWPKWPVTRRSFTLSLLIVPMACLGCGGYGDTVVTEGGGSGSRGPRSFRRRRS